MKDVDEVDSLSYLAARNGEIRQLRDYYNYNVENEKVCSLSKNVVIII